MHWRRKWQPTPVFFLENPRDGGAWWAAVYGVAQSQTQLKWLSSSSSRKQSWPTCSYRLSTRRQHSFMLNCDSTCNQSLGESQLPGLRIRLDCAWANSQEFRSHYFFPKSSTPPPRLIPAWGMAPCCGAKESALSGRRLQLGTPAPGDLNTWWLHLGPLGLRVRPPSFGCTLDSGHSQGKPGKTGLKDVSWRALCWPQSSHGTQHYPGSRDRILSQIMEVSGCKLGFTFHSCSFLYSHADAILKYGWFAFCACPQCPMDWFSYDIYIEHNCTFLDSFAI